MSTRRKIRRRTIRRQRRAKEAHRYLAAIGADSAEIDGTTLHRLSEEELLVFHSLLQGGPMN